MTIENFNLWVENDPDNRISTNVSGSDAIMAALQNAETGLLTDDKGINFFDNDFTHKFKLNISSGSGLAGWWCVANGLDPYTVLDNTEDFLHFHNGGGGGAPVVAIAERFSGGVINDVSGNLATNTDYWITIIRDESVGSFGSLTCIIYSDSARTVIVDTIAILLSAKLNLRYIYAIQSRGSAGTTITSSILSDLDLGIEEPVLPPEPPTPVPSPVPKITTHNQDAKNRLLEQYKGKAGIEGLIEAYFGDQIQDLEDVLQLFFDRLNIEISEGVQLDGIGKIVDQDRLGLTDELYRLFIRGRIGANVSEGDIERLIEVWKTITQANIVKLEEIFPAEVNLATDVALPDNLIDIAFALIQKVSGAGIGVGITTFLPEGAFSFAGADPTITKGFGTLVSQGTTDGTSINKLDDSGASFITDGVNVTMQAMNDTDGIDAGIILIDSETQLSLDDDIFVTGEDYYINANLGGQFAKIQGA